MGVATVVILCAVAVCLVVAGALISGSKDDDDHYIRGRVGVDRNGARSTRKTATRNRYKVDDDCSRIPQE